MTQLKRNDSLAKLQQFSHHVYGLSDDRYFSLEDLLANQTRFTMRAIKGIRKQNKRRLKHNLIIALSWSMAVSNRLHIAIEDVVWERFPMLCSYCGHKPCVCKKEKIKNRVNITKKYDLRPGTIAGFQRMFEEIYPSSDRTLDIAGVHLAEEMGEVLEAVSVFNGQHRPQQFKDVSDELADWISCVFGVANSAGIDVAKELEVLFYNNCHVCHTAPCSCSYTSVATYQS